MRIGITIGGDDNKFIHIFFLLFLWDFKGIYL